MFERAEPRLNRAVGQWHLLLVAVTALWTGSAPAEDDDALTVRHRLDLGLSFLESQDFDSLIGLFSYTYNATPRSNISVTMPYLDSDFGTTSGTGIGDTEVVYTWSPSVELSVAPWVPKTAGTGLAVVLPTGGSSGERGLDSFILAPFLGLAIKTSDHFYINPSLIAAISLDKTVTGKHVRLGVAELRFAWLSGSGLWAAVYPVYVKDFEAGTTHSNLGVELGKIAPSGLGVSLKYDFLEHFNPGLIPSDGNRFDRAISVNLNLVF